MLHYLNLGYYLDYYCWWLFGQTSAIPRPRSWGTRLWSSLCGRRWTLYGRHWTVCDFVQRAPLYFTERRRLRQCDIIEVAKHVGAEHEEAGDLWNEQANAFADGENTRIKSVHLRSEENRSVAASAMSSWKRPMPKSKMRTTSGSKPGGGRKRKDRLTPSWTSSTPRRASSEHAHGLDRVRAKVGMVMDKCLFIICLSL